MQSIIPLPETTAQLLSNSSTGVSMDLVRHNCKCAGSINIVETGKHPEWKLTYPVPRALSVLLRVFNTN